MMRRALIVLFPLLALGLAGCPSKPKNGECNNNQDCEAQEGYGKICVQGHCQECGQDSDCKEGFICQANKCVPKAEASSEKPECESDGDCGEGKACLGGRCVTKEVANTSPEGCSNLEDINFGFDEYSLSPEARTALDHHASCVKATKVSQLTIAGNCDERGTAEYNLQLGQKRADVAKKYLENLGVERKTLKTVSYGKGRPVCNEHDEGCWAKNRRDAFATE